MSDEQIRKIPEYLKPYFNEVSQFQHYYEYEKNMKGRRNIDDRFVCLKGFSSTTPIINSASFGRECLGGGFYFRYGGHGIAVDPGMGFISLMHRNNIFIDDIDTVIVTHSHLDHNCDVRGLSALKYDYNKNRNKAQKFFSDFFECSEANSHCITWYMDEETIEETSDILKDDEVYALSACCNNSGKEISENIKLCALKTNHVKGNDRTYGIKLSFDLGLTQYEWGYTSDTRFFVELGEFFEDVSALIFNISDIYPSDVRGQKSKNAHLGFDGSLKLLKKAKPKMALASEFCCTNGDYRYEVVKALRQSSNIRVYPSDPGMVLDISGNLARCSFCKKDVPIEYLQVVRPEEEFGSIRYVCSECLL